MAIDGILLNGLVGELQATLINARVDKIQQPEKDEIHIIMRNQGENYKLLLSASASHPRIHLTKINKINPQTPPMFCMVLRKHLTGGKLVSIHQPSFERIIEISFEVLNEMGDLTEKKLIIEIMGRHSNIIFIDSAGKILDSIKHVGINISRVREVLPGITYTYPPSQGKSDPRCANEDTLTNYLNSLENTQRPDRAVTDAFTGISKTSAEEIINIASNGDYGSIRLDEQGIPKVVTAFISFFYRVQQRQFNPVLIVDEQNKPKDILPFSYSLFSPELLKPYPNFSDALDDFFAVSDKVDRIQQRTTHLHKVIKTNLDRCEKKLALQLNEVEEAKKGDIYRLYGELLIANIYNIPDRIEQVSLLNYYDPENDNIIIPMDKTKTPSQNAQVYYKMYNKTKTVIEKQTKFILDTQNEISYLESLSEYLSKSSDEADILEIKEELIREGYIRRTVVKGKPKPRFTSKPHHYLSSDGFEIFVGKNNIQNDLLTLKMAVSCDLWLHTKVIPGSHVIIKTKGESVPENTILEAANLAAYHSKGRLSGNVPVDYCPKKNVKKPGGAKPGMVIYDHYNTIYVTPSEDMVQRMKKL